LCWGGGGGGGGSGQKNERGGGRKKRKRASRAVAVLTEPRRPEKRPLKGYPVRPVRRCCCAPRLKKKGEKGWPCRGGRRKIARATSESGLFLGLPCAGAPPPHVNRVVGRRAAAAGSRGRGGRGPEERGAAGAAPARVRACVQNATGGVGFALAALFHPGELNIRALNGSVAAFFSFSPEEAWCRTSRPPGAPKNSGARA